MKHFREVGRPRSSPWLLGIRWEGPQCLPLDDLHQTGFRGLFTQVPTPQLVSVSSRELDRAAGRHASLESQVSHKLFADFYRLEFLL